METLKSILESKLGSEITKIGEDNLAKLETIGFEEEVGSLFKTSLLSLTEAETTPSIIQKNKDAWHREAKKSMMDSFDSIIEPHTNVLTEIPADTKDKHKAVLLAYKEKTQSLEEQVKSLLEKVQSGVSEADTKALLKEKDEEIKRLKDTYIEKDSVKGIEDEVKTLKREIESYTRHSVKNTVVGTAIKSGLLKDLNPELLDDIVWTAVKKYNENAVYGLDSVKAEIVFDKDTKQVAVRQKGDNSISVTKDGKIISVDDIVKAAINHFDLSKKSDGDNFQQFTPKQGQQNGKQGVILAPTILSY